MPGALRTSVSYLPVNAALLFNLKASVLELKTFLKHEYEFVFSLSIHTTAAANVTLLAFAAARRAAAPLLLSIDISCPRGAQQQTRRTLLQRSIDRTDGRTDGRTDTGPLITMRAVSNINRHDMF